MTSLDEISVGQDLPSLPKGRWTTSRIVRWCAAQENWDRVHYDLDFARDRANLPYTIINGGLKQHLLAQYLDEAFDGMGWVWRLDYRFTATDLVGHSLQVEGRVADRRESGGHIFVTVDLGIRDLDTGEVTTTGRGTVILAESGAPVTGLDGIETPADLDLDEDVTPPEDSVPGDVRAALGKAFDAIESDYAVDHSRLRLFAEAVMGVRPIHYDPVAARDGPYGAVVGMPLFPFHGLSCLPGRFELGDSDDALGREGVAEVGRNIAVRFGIDPSGMLNGGNKVAIHSLVRAGERITADSTLVGAKYRTGSRGGRMVFFETLNRYREIGGRPLVTERQTIVHRLDPRGEGDGE